MLEQTSLFILSAFGDEIDDDLDNQLKVLNELGIGYLELRNVWGTNVLKLRDEEIERLKLTCGDYGVQVSCIGSPVGKSPIQDRLDQTLADLARILDIAEALDTNSVRIFSFYPPEDGQQSEYVDKSISRLKSMADIAEERGSVLLLENENGLVGDIPERCRDIVEGVGSSSLQFVWDTGNFPHTGVEHAVNRGWHLLSKYVRYVQVKDTRISDRTITVAGDGDGQVLELLERLRDFGYQGFLALEPHLKKAGQRGGYSGPDGMRRATEALRGLMAQAGCVEAKGYPGSPN
jgi:sugar phosphate isomerase/epimerase